MKKPLSLMAFCAATLVPLGALAANPMVELKTSEGTLVLKLYPEKAPKSVENFLQYVKDGFYNGTVFHRVIEGFMIQGGGFDAQMKQKPTRGEIINEARNGLKNDRGTIAMARRGDPNSASSQFFINHVDNRGLNFPQPDGHGYAVFGKLTSGLDVLDKIAKVPTGNHPSGHQNVPRTPVVLESATIINSK